MPRLWVRVDLGAIAMKEYSTFPKLQHYWNLTIRLCHIQGTHCQSLTPLQKTSQCILQPQPTGQNLLRATVIHKRVKRIHVINTTLDSICFFFGVNAVKKGTKDPKECSLKNKAQHGMSISLWSTTSDTEQSKDKIRGPNTSQIIFFEISIPT